MSSSVYPCSLVIEFKSAFRAFVLAVECFAVDLLRGIRLELCRDHCVEFFVVKREQVASVVVERVEQRAEDLVVPLGEFRRAVVGDTERGRLRIVEFRSDDRDLGPAETLRRFERAVTGDDDLALIDDDRLLLSERAERVADRGEVAFVVLPRVRRVLRDRVDRNCFGLYLVGPFFFERIRSLVHLRLDLFEVSADAFHHGVVDQNPDDERRQVVFKDWNERRFHQPPPG